jgi:hypothetical protein
LTQVIQVTNYPDQTFRITLEGLALSARIWWSQYDDATKVLVGDGIEGQWYLDFFNTDGTVTAYGVALVTGCDILEPYAIDGLGGLWLVGADDTGSDPDLFGMGDTHSIIYVPVAERAQFNRDIGWTR